jgi:hypothetical protein
VKEGTFHVRSLQSGLAARILLAERPSVVA